jgi:hypothetical protein
MHLVALVVGAGRLDRSLDEAEGLLLAYRGDSGAEYLDHEPSTHSDELRPEDLAVTSLVNSRFTMDAFRSLARHGHEIDLRSLPHLPLERTTAAERGRVADLIATVAQWRGFATSVATKVLHKKRPSLIPMLDNLAIFGAYMNPLWPEHPASMESVKSQVKIKEALDWIAYDLTRSENASVWQHLHTIEPSRSRIQLFDSVWWMHFRQIEPVRGSSVPAATPIQTISTDLDNALDGLVVFANDERGYLAWLDAHPHGYVLNCDRKPKASYLKLHLASCGRINGTPPRGSTWTNPYIKVCAADRAAIEGWALRLTSAPVSPCGWCSRP